MPNLLKKLCDAIEYPEPPPANAMSFVMRVDGSNVLARQQGSKLILSKVIDQQENNLEKLCSYAAGRILKEEAVLSWDDRSEACILWQSCSANADAAELKSFFETFMNSCDWWVARAVEMGAPPPVFPNIVIRP